jgi:hypothetical protein
VSSLASDVDMARSIAHPKLLKLLGFVRSEGRSYLASEYVPGMALTELRAAVRRSAAPLRAAVAARIVRDALAASVTARELLRDATGIDPVSAFHPDVIWIAEFGETLLAPVPAELQRDQASSEVTSGSAADSPAGLLLELSTGLTPAQVLADGIDAHLPAALAEALTGALSREARGRTDGDSALLERLSALQAPLLANDDQVKHELVRVAANALQLRRGLVGMSDEGTSEADANEATMIARLPRAGLRHDNDEPTRVSHVEHLERDADPDGVTQLLPKALPTVIVAAEPRLPRPSSAPPGEWAKQFLEDTQLSARRQQSSTAPPPLNKGVRAAPWIAFVAALLALLFALLRR